MKIAYCLKDLITIGGLQKIVILKANWLVDHGFEVIFIITDGCKEIPYKIDNRIKIINLNINYYKQKSRNYLSKIYYHYYNTYLHRKKLKDTLSRFNIDIVVSTFGNEMGILSGISCKSKKILEFHGSKYIYEKYVPETGIRRILDRYFRHQMYRQIRSFDKFVILSEKELHSWNSNNVVAIPNALFDVAANDFGDCGESKKIVAVGRIEAEKDFRTLVEIWREVSINHKGWKLYIYGYGSEYTTIQNEISKYHLDNTIQLPGYISDLDHIYKDAAIYVLTSKYEGFSLSTLEACAYGLPIVAFECGGEVAAMVRDGYNGYLIKNRDTKKFVEKLITLIENPEIRINMGYCSKSIPANYSVTSVMEKWIQLFDGLVKS